MPHYFQFYTNFKENEAHLTIKTAAEKLLKPLLIVHGDLDETVSLTEAKNMNSWCSSSQLEIISGANHSFGSSQPWKQDAMPSHLSLAVDLSYDFIID